MATLRYTGTHQPQNMIIDVEEKEVKRLLDSGEYETLENKEQVKIVKSLKVEAVDDDSKRIKKRFQ